MTCPYLEYRRDGDDRSFEKPRAFCSVADRFVQPMRADVCNDRYDLDHANHCEIYLAARAERGDVGTSSDGDEGE